MKPELIETEIIDNPDEVAAILNSLHLNVAGILAMRDSALSHYLDAGPLMAANAPGTLAYHYGLLEMRVQFIGSHYRIDRTGGVEAIVSHDGSRKLVFQNVDMACSRASKPNPRTEKGTGSEKMCVGNLFDFAGVKLPELVRNDRGRTAVYFVMVDERGAVEVTRPVVKDGKFTGFIIRLFVSNGSDLEAIDPKEKPLAPPMEDFEVSISRK